MGNPILFILLQLINVIFSTIKTLAVTKGTKSQAVLISGIYYGYYSFVIKAVASPDNNVIFVALVTMFTNFLGVFISLTLMDKLKKDRLWLMKITVSKQETEELKREFTNNNIKYLSLVSNWEKMDAIEVYSYTKEETTKIKNIINEFESVKSCVIETTRPNI